ncbi:hypothetical protein D1872_277910 [compost metagenome]
METENFKIKGGIGDGSYSSIEIFYDESGYFFGGYVDCCFLYGPVIGKSFRPRLR